MKYKTQIFRQGVLALAVSATLGLNTPAYAENFAVTVPNDNGIGDTANTLSWAILQANSNGSADTITVATDVKIEGVMKTLIDSDVILQGDGVTPRSISGEDAYRPLFIKSGTVSIKDLILEKGRAEGGSSRFGGAGAGLGGALFIYDGSVTVDNVEFKDNTAQGGSSLSNNFIDDAGGYLGSGNGGGGMFGSGISDGGGGLFASSFDNNSAYGGNGNYSGGSGGGFGGGGDPGDGGNGGFGGGSGSYSGANGGFGGGGGFSYYGSYSHGGFGGGGGGDGYYGGGYGGYGGGNGYSLSGGTGGGGAGFGGAIFAMQGETNLKDVSFSNNTVVAGQGLNNGTANAADVFICTNDLHATASTCSAVVNQCGTTSTNETIGTLSTCYVLPANEWHQVSLPADTGANTVNDIFGDDKLGTYATHWIIHRYDASTNSYVALTLTDTMSQGVGYWIIQLTDSDKILDMPANSSITPTTTPSHCVGAACFEISLTTTSGVNQWNMIGYPFSEEGLLSNSRIVTTTPACDPCTVDEAATENIFSSQLFRYNGSAYVAVDTTSNVLTVWQGYWAATLSSADGTEPTLLFSKP